MPSKSDAYFGVPRTTKPAETLSISVPTISTTHYVTLVHNTNVSATLANTTKSLDLSAWKEPADMIISCKPVPDLNRAYMSETTIFGTMYTSGNCNFADYTSALVSVLYFQRLVFAANGYDGVKRLILFKNSQYMYRADIQFTDVYGVTQQMKLDVYPERSNRFVDLRVLKIDRTAALWITITYFTSSSSDKLYENGVFATTGYFRFNGNAPVQIGIDCLNSVDEAMVDQLPVVDSGVKAQVARYMNSYSVFIENDGKLFGLEVSNWIDFLAHAASFAISKGWAEADDYNNMLEVKNLSLSLVGAMTEIGTGNFTSDPLIPEHFTVAIENVMQSGGDRTVLFVAALWAICDNIELEASLN